MHFLNPKIDTIRNFLPWFANILEAITSALNLQEHITFFFEMSAYNITHVYISSVCIGAGFVAICIAIDFVVGSATPIGCHGLLCFRERMEAHVEFY